MATKAQIENIIERTAPHAQKYAKQYGYHVCSPCIAQLLQESLGKYEGLSLLAYKYHNYHGIKEYPKWTGQTVRLKTSEEYVKGILTPVYADFCVFESEEQGIEQYYLFLERNKRYSNLKQCLTPYFYLTTIKNDGYCTSTTYVSNCMNKINAYGLTKYDSNNVAETEEEYQAGKVYTTTSDLYIRDAADGKKIKHGALTEDAIKHSHFDNIGYAILDKGTRVSCKEVNKLETSTWIRIPSGWICAKNSKNTFVKE